MIDEVLRNSVTKADRTERGLLMRFSPFLSAPLVSLVPDIPAWWTPKRDTVLRSAYVRGGLWNTCVKIAATRVASQGYELDGDVGVRVRKARSMVGREWVNLLQKLARDYVTQDNGAFLEVVRAGRAYSAKVVGFQYLSSARCIRTGDPDIPVVYIDRQGALHEMRSHQIAEFSDMPDDDLNGVGISATSNAYDDIYVALAVKTFVREKITGRRPLAIDFINGIGDQRLDDALADAERSADVKGYRAYMGAAVSASATDQALSHVRLSFADLPQGFDQATFDAETKVLFASHLGVDPTDIDPRLIGNRALGAGSQAQVLDEKQNAKGMIAFRQQLAQFFNDTERWHPLPGGVTFAWSERDLKDQSAKAQLAKLRADTRAAQIASGEITATQSTQLAVDAGDLPASFIAVDTTQEETITDEDKAEAGSALPGASLTPTADVVQPQPGAPQPAPVAAKALEDALTTIKRMPAGATILARFEPPAEPPRDAKSDAAYWRAVTKQFDEIGSAWTAAAEPPQAEGETKRSLGYTIKNRNSNLVRLELHAGNTARPEVAIRAVLYGRKGFGPKRAKVLRFKVGGKTVYARKVRGAAANDWFSRSIAAIQPQIKAAQKSLGQFAASEIQVSDVDGARRYNVAPPAPSDAAIKRARAAARGKEIADALEIGGVL